jgi:hypothetical protein
MNDAEVTEMRDQIAKELKTDPMDGGVVLPVGGDGITRYPSDATGAPIPPDDVVKYDGGETPDDQAKQATADLATQKADDPDLDK